MQAAVNVSRWLLQTKGITAQEEWVKACVEWILTEEGSHTSQQKLKDLVYEQWLHADLRDVATQPCVPDGVGQKQECKISRRVIVQVDSIIDVGAPAYGQLQKLKGQLLDTADALKKNFEPKPTRLLLLNLTDGVSDFQAMEYQPIPHLSSQTPPGTKLLLQGNIDCHLGVLLLAGANVQVLGGSVEQLVERNQQKRLLARALNNESLAEDNQPASGTNPLQSNLQAASVGQPPNSTSTAHLSSPEPDVVIVDVVPGTDRQHQRPPAASSSGSNRIRGRRGGEGNSRSGGPPSRPRGSRESDTMAIRSTATGTSTRAASPGVYHSGSSLQSVGSGRYEGVECRITGEHSAVSDHEQYSDGVVAEDLDVDVGDMDFDDFDNFDEQEPEHKYGEQGAQLEEMDHSDYRDVPFVGSSGYNVGNEETMPTDTKVPATTASVEKEASWWRSSDTTLSKSSEIHQKTLSLKQRSFKPEFMNALVEDPANEVTATIKPPVASVKPMPVTNSRQLSSRKSLVISSEFEGVETFHDSPSEAPFHARGSPFVPGKEKPALLKLSDVCSGSVWNNSPVVRVKAYFIKVVEKLSHASGKWMVTVLIGDDTGAKLHVHLSNEILELLIGFTAEEFKQNIEPYKSNPAVKTKGSQGFKRCQSALADLNCFMELRKQTFHRYPFVEKLLDSA